MHTPSAGCRRSRREPRAGRRWLACACGGLLAAATAGAETLQVSIIDKPPYYYLESGQPTGFLVDKLRALASGAGMATRFELLPPKRALQDVQGNRSAVCSLGWFKTPERLAFAQFTLPLYHDRPFVAVVRRGGSLEGPPVSIRSLLASEGVRVATIAGYSYGSTIDAAIREVMSDEIVLANHNSALMMLAADRADLLLLSPEEVEHFFPRSPDLARRLATRVLSDIPDGQERYLICSRLVPAATIDRINAEIRRADARERKR